MVIAIFSFGVLITIITVVALMLVGVTEAADKAHGRSDTEFSERERKVAKEIKDIG